MRFTKMITTCDRKSGKVIERKIIDDVDKVDPRDFYLPIFETLLHKVLVDVVKAKKKDLYENLEKGVGL